MINITESAFDGTQAQIVTRTWRDDSAPSLYVAVLVHGYGEHIGRYEHVAAALVDNGAIVYGLDHLGHGKSGGERVLVSNFEDVVADVDHVVTEANQTWPDLPIVMIGHSMGGMIAARYAQLHAGRLRALVLSGPAVGEFELLDQLLMLDEMPDVPLDPEVLSRDPAVGDAYAADQLVWHGPFKRSTVAAMVATIRAINEGGSLGALPVLWAHGADDQLVPIGGTRSGIERLCSEDVRKHEYPGARHEVFNETNRAEVLGDLTGFIDDVLGGANA